MIVTSEAELDGLKEIGRICANVLQGMARAVEPGMTTLELDDIGRAMLEAAGAVSAPEAVYQFPGATCISVNEEVAHGIPSGRVIRAGDLVNIDVSASKNGYFADNGASFGVGQMRPVLDQLCRDGKKAMQIGVKQVAAGKPLNGIGMAIERFAKPRGYTLIRNLASHGVGNSLHEYPEEIPTWTEKRDKRVIEKGLVLTVEPFLSMGGEWADTEEDGWTLYAEPSAPTVQYEHTVVATEKGVIIVTIPD
ncbi:MULTISPECIES: type I methionyl aminopeptidase [Thioclava]|uniref:Methionine aminopeptidase n=1 Tax=Thioclava litoralis TaxID=3076557 RepID=A0ABZ1DYX7_9RHOB|nr:type I methionyl aminopeptidase [Thioclava sp. FTW29]